MFWPDNLQELGERLTFSKHIDAPYLNKIGILLARKKAKLPVGLLGRQSTVSPIGGDR